jgi:transposase
MNRARKTYTLEFRVKAVELSNQRGSLTQVADELNVKRDTLKRWKKQYQAGKMQLNGKVLQSTDELELIRVRRELHEVTLERDILKKAVSIFSKSDR